jgi:hypothetical protein
MGMEEGSWTLECLLWERGVGDDGVCFVDEWTGLHYRRVG